MENIVLIGFMGVGKGTVARELSKEMKKICIDTDDIIESMENCKIKKIFEKNGESYFRKLEREVACWLQKSIKDTIISTGGGFYRVNNIKKIGKVIYLKSSFDAILKRIKDHPNAKRKIAKRPLLKDKKAARALYEQRVKEYQKISDLEISVENRSLKEIVDEIKRNI